jgi:hypothetical protein
VQTRAMKTCFQLPSAAYLMQNSLVIRQSQFIELTYIQVLQIAKNMDKRYKVLLMSKKP